jgi:hypothetical protein
MELVFLSAALLRQRRRGDKMEESCLGVVPALELDGANEARPSASFIYAVSEFLDTDPDDLLAELGYYDRDLVTPL